MALYEYTHIMPIGKDIEHVKTAIKEPKWHPIGKIYLIHSPDNSKDKLEQIAKKLQKDLQKTGNIVVLKKLSATGAFEMNSILDEITKIEREEHGDDATPLSDIVVNVTGGTNMMAVASLWAASSLKLDAYYVLNKKRNPGLKSYLVEIATPKFTRFSVSAKNPDHQEILNVLYEETFSWEGLPESKPGKEPVNIDEKIKNSDWIIKQTREGVSTYVNLKKIMKEKYNVPNRSTENRIDQMETDGLVTVKYDVPKHSVRGKEYPRHEYFIDERAKLVSITAMGKSALLFYKPPK